MESEPFELLSAWPDILEQTIEDYHGLERAAVLIRIGRFHEGEYYLQAHLSSLSYAGRYNYDYITALALLCAIKLQANSLSQAKLVLNELCILDLSDWRVRCLQYQYIIQSGGDVSEILSSEPSAELICNHPQVAFPYIAALISSGKTEKANLILDRLLDSGYKSLETLRFKASILQLVGRSIDAFELLFPLLVRAPRCRFLANQALELAIITRQLQQAIVIARNSLQTYGEHPEFLNNITAIKLLQRQPGYARRSSLLLQAWNSVGDFNSGLTNLICSYEQCGNADWLDHLHPAIWTQPLANEDLSSNLVLHLASTQSSRYKPHLQNLVSAMALRREQYISTLRITPPCNQLSYGDSPMTIVWLSPDFTPHPVSRFLQHYFAASKNSLAHSHMMISLTDHGRLSNLDWFKSTAGLETYNISNKDDNDKISAIRELKADIVIDLAGWTGGNFARGLLEQLAPVQVNYLGYFATSGIPAMDYWLGDLNIFPESTLEWHSELLWRLDRPFLAWQPPSDLPEGQVSVCEPPSGPVRFGSFNHNRKLSDKTLQLWSEILRIVTDSRLVLKANAGSDVVTQEILAHRMRAHGIDPDRVDWLPLTNTSTEHLLQYRHIDIALDPLPNGGCTTTCEALWMGCPVLTLAGDHYVSRMSTAVLLGADIGEWVAETCKDYVELAALRAINISILRQQRDIWRHRIFTSQLGDALGLMTSLEAAFREMKRNKHSAKYP